jgi:RNA polymerase sigma factor (TIGR02999 family)
MSSPDQVADALRRVRLGDRAAVNDLMDLIYPELHRIAAAYFRGERHGHTLQPTALVNETYLRLVNQRLEGCHDRVQFLAVAAILMRRVLLNHARGKLTEKRGEGALAVELTEDMATGELRMEELLAIDQALTALAEVDAEQAQLVEMRYFEGMSFEEIAEALGYSVITAKRRWASARAWLRTKLESARALSEVAGGSRAHRTEPSDRDQ